MNNPKTLNLIRKILIAGVGLLVIILVILLLFSSTKTNSDTVDIGPKPGDPFFESPAVYYLKAAGSNQVFPSVIHLMKTLKMDDKEAAETEFKKLNLRESGENNDNKEYFIYKALDQVVYTFAISFELEYDEQKPVKIKIKMLEGGDPNKIWGEYLLERKQGKTVTQEFLYSFKYLGGNYAAATISRYFGNNLSEKPFDAIIENIANGITETINNNPRDAAKNGPKLILELTLLGDNEKEIGSPGQISLPLILVKDRIISEKKENGVIDNRKIETYEITEERKASLEYELKTELTKLFPAKEENRGELRRQIDIFKGDESISDSSYWLQDQIAVRVKAVISDTDMGADSFDTWKEAFDVKGAGVSLVELKTYKKERLSKIGTTPDDKLKPSSDGSGMIYTIIVIMVLLVGIYFWSGRELKRIKEQKSPVDQADPDKEEITVTTGIGEISGKVRMEEEKTRPEPDKDKKDTGDEQKGPEVSEKVDVKKYPSIEEIRDKLKKIGNSVENIRSLAIGGGQPIESIKHLNDAENTIKEILDSKKISREFLTSKIEKIRENLKEIRKDEKMDFFKKDVETELKELGKIYASVMGHSTAYSFQKGQFTIEQKVPTEKDSTEILRGIDKFWENLKKRLFKGKEDIEIEIFVADTIKAPTGNKELIKENQVLIEGNRDLLGEIKGTLSQLGITVNRIDRESQNEARFYKMMQYFNDETDLKVNKNNVNEILEKVCQEKDPSKKYRACAVGLYKELLELEEKYNEKWFWRLLNDSFLTILKDDIEFFAISNGKGRTIYDRYLGEGTPLRNIEQHHIRKIVETNHWTKIWDGLIRMSDFFNAYFDNDMDDIKFALGNYSQKMKKILIELGYSIEERKPLSLISTEYRKKKDFELIDKTYIEKFVLKELKESENKQFKEAMLNIPYGEERVIYVDRLGLTDKFVEPNIAITKLRFAAYNQGILQARFSSKPRTTEPDELGD